MVEEATAKHFQKPIKDRIDTLRYTANDNTRI